MLRNGECLIMEVMYKTNSVPDINAKQNKLKRRDNMPYITADKFDFSNPVRKEIIPMFKSLVDLSIVYIVKV